MIKVIKQKVFNIHDNSLKKYLNDNNISHYLFTFDLLEYNFKDINRTFNCSYFTKDDNLLNKFLDKNELRDYEFVEDDKNILIKKFKLRVSAQKNDEFSGDIVISDDYMFDFINLNHTDSLIKIAVIRDNIDNWLNSGKLGDYDFIFTVNNEFLNSVKENHNHVLLLTGNSIYLQLKNILNLLYVRRKEKFYYFVNDKFHYIFPKTKNYFKILHSEFFEDEWYRSEYEIPLNTDSVFHYLMVGYLKGYNPGPDFSSDEYYELNGDVKLADMNPLLHYELYGRKENRKYKLSKEEFEEKYSFLYNSPYYDEEWYVKKYNISEDEITPLYHYMRIGYKKGYNPGPDFSTDEYYKINPDVEKAGMNPLLHYEKYGRSENRKYI